MESFEFRAGTARDDRIMGLSYPAIFMFPILLTRLLIFYLGLRVDSSLVAILQILPGLWVSYFFIKNIQKRRSRNYLVTLDHLSIRILENGNEILFGYILSCHIKSATDKLVRLDIRTDDGKISYRARPKGNQASTFNPFGNSSSSDMAVLLSLGQAIKAQMEEKNDD